jgi:outer membrane receptor protein involved in Fe transport
VAKLVILAALAAAGSALAQGITGSALTGTVTKDKGGPVEGAAIQLRNPATGDTLHTVSTKSGAYFIDNVPPGGPYILTATAEGFQPSVVQDVTLALGQRLALDILMRAELVEEIAVVAHLDANADKGRTGPSSIKKSAEILALPLQGRNFTSLVLTDPRVTSQGEGFSIAGQNNRFNNIQIDGGANNDLFGLANNGTPGGQAAAKPLSLEAVQEFVVQVAPFDVRQGDFAGGLVNAITKSGTNTFHGGLFGYYQNKSLTNQNAYINGVNQTDLTYNGYHTLQYGAFLGGPIIQDQAHFFISGDIQSKEASFGSPYNLTGNNCADPAQAAACASDLARVGFTSTEVNRFIGILNKYGITNAGDASSPNLSNPDRNLFAKVTSNQIPNSRLELSYNLVSASQDVLARNPFGVSVPFFLSGGFQLSNSGYGISNTTNTGRVKLTTNWDESRLSNEFLGGVSIIRDSRTLANTAPLIIVNASPAGTVSPGFLAAGAERFSQANALDQDIYQLQDNLTLAVDQHRITFGTSNEFFKFRNLFLQAAIGAWEFASLDDFAAGKATAYNRRFSVDPRQEPGTARFNVNQFGFYLQDEYAASENFALTGGLRVDIPFLSKPITNQAVLTNSPLAIDTGKVPTGNPLWSPRLGFNWDVAGDSDTIVRGGVGVFSGRPPYVWVSNAYSINGLSQVQLTCGAPASTTVPTFITADPQLQPTDCTGGTGTLAAPANFGEIDYFDPNTKYPQNLRVALGADERLPWGLLASADLLYTEDVNGWYTSDENLNYLGTDGEGRATYGALSTVVNAKTGVTSLGVKPSRIDTKNLTQAVKVFNKNGGKVASATIQVQKPFARRFGVSVAYTFSRSQDRMSFTSSQALSNFRFSPVDGDLENRNVRPSAFDRPHKITITGTAALPLGFAVGLSYIGQSGTPYTWVVNGDINGDGINFNDTPFIPANANQITLQNPAQYAALDAFINSQSCLRDARGSLLQRGACRNPWNDFFDVRLTWTSPNWKGQRLEAQWDIFNVLNLLNSSWGHYNEVTPFETANTQFLSAVGYDTTNRRPIYSFSAPSSVSNTVYSPTQSRWRMQFGARYLF